MIDYTKNYTVAGQTKTYDYGLREYMLKIYQSLALALVVTGFASVAALNFSPLTNLLYQNSGGHLSLTFFSMIVAFAPIGIAIYLSSKVMQLELSTARALFFLYAFLTGLSLSSLGLVYTSASITRTFFICAAAFAGISIYGYTVKKDLTSMGTLMRMGLIGVIIVTIINIFLQSEMISFAISGAAVIVFLGLIARDTQQLKNIYYNYGIGEVGQKVAILGAFQLYLNFINLFIHLLRLLGETRRRD